LQVFSKKIKNVSASMFAKVKNSKKVLLPKNKIYLCGLILIQYEAYNFVHISVFRFMHVIGSGSAAEQHG